MLHFNNLQDRLMLDKITLGTTNLIPVHFQVILVWFNPQFHWAIGFQPLIIFTETGQDKETTQCWMAMLLEHVNNKKNVNVTTMSFLCLVI